MKKSKLLITPFLVLPFILNCGGGGGGNDPVRKHSLSFTGTNCDLYLDAEGQTKYTTTEYEGGYQFSGYIIASYGYNLPETVTFTSGGEPYVAETTSYDKTTGALSVKMVADIAVTAKSDPIPEDPKDYLCFTCNSGSGSLKYGFYDKSPLPNINLSSILEASTISLEYSKDKITWFEAEPLVVKDLKVIGEICDVEAGDKVYLRGDNPDGFNIQYLEYTIDISFVTPQTSDQKPEPTADLTVSGNIMSIIDKTNFEKITEITAEDCFSWLFGGCSAITDASNLSLPATKLSEGCYNRMFYLCTELTKAPKELPAMELSESCYNDMFFGCEKLLASPKLPATNLVSGCYHSMFEYCTKLEKIEVGFGTTGKTEWPSDDQGTNCTSSWAFEVNNTSGVFIWNGSTDKAALTADNLFNENQIPEGWTVENPKSVL